MPQLGHEAAQPASDAGPGRRVGAGNRLLTYLTTTDHKVIGNMYMVTAFGFFLLGGFLAMLMRAELTRPGLQLVSSEQYNQLFTIHGTVMMLLFATPMFAGFANAVMPLQIGAPDVAFPRLNALTYWLFLFGGLIVVSGFVVPGGAAAFGWFAYAPLNSAVREPGAGGNLWAMGLVLAGLSTTLGSVNFIATIVSLRAPGMTMFRMPIFTWNILFTSILALLAFPVLAAALLCLVADRKFGAHIFDSANGGAILWQHLFWFSATRRSISSPCRSSAWSARSFRCSAASRCSAIWAWSQQRSSSPCSPRSSGPTTCSPRERCCCRSSPSCRS